MKLFASNVRKCLTGLCLRDSETNRQDWGDFKMDHLTHYSQCWQYYWSLTEFSRIFSPSRNTSHLFTEMTPLNCLLERDSAHPYRLTGDPSHCKDIKNVWYSWLNNCTVPGGAPWGRAFVHQLTEKRADRQHGCFWTLTMWAAWLTVRPETSNDPSDSSSQWCVKSQQDDVSYAVSVPHAAFANICQFKPLKWGYLLLFSVYIS